MKLFKKKDHANDAQVRRIYREMEMHSPTSKEYGDLCRRLEDIQKVKDGEKRNLDWKAIAMIVSALITGAFSTYQVNQIRKDELDPDEPKIYNNSSKAWSLMQKPK